MHVPLSRMLAPQAGRFNVPAIHASGVGMEATRCRLFRIPISQSDYYKLLKHVSSTGGLTPRNAFLGGPHPGCRPPFLLMIQNIGIDEVHGFHFTEPYTLRISPTKITLDDLAVSHIVLHGAKGANTHACPAADAYIIIDLHTSQFFITRNRARRTTLPAGGILALLANHWNILAFGFPLDDFNSAPGRVADPVMRNRADKFA
jgi:hypothetical protein